MAQTTTIMVMGVSGSGKTTVMRALAGRLGWPCAEGDDFHPPGNVAKMAGGRSLTDEDRRPWLEALAQWIGVQEAAGRNAIVTCSALRRAYRDLLRDGHDSVWFAHLVAPRDTLAGRLDRRSDHYMPASLLQSQLDTLEPLDPGEPGAVIDASVDVEAVVGEIHATLPRTS